MTSLPATPPAVYVALCGREYVESGPDLRRLVELLTREWESCGESVALWCGGRLAAIMLDDPRTRRPVVIYFDRAPSGDPIERAFRQLRDGAA
jgi:hypothetical protein